MRRSIVNFIIAVCFLFLANKYAAHAELTVELITQTGAGGQVVYPQIEGLSDARIQDDINGTIVKEGRINEHILTLSSIASEGGWGINVSTEYILHTSNNGSDILSVLLTARGKMPNGRFGHIRTPMNFNLSTGKPLRASDIFTDVENTAFYLEQYIYDRIQPGLSSYLENNTLMPVPMSSFYLTRTGIMFCYDMDKFSMLSGDSGAIELKYYELQGYMDDSPSGFPMTFETNQWVNITGDTAALIADDAQSGILPGISLQIGAPLQDAIDAYRLLCDPDYSQGGMVFELEDARYRNVKIITSTQTVDYSNLKITGIQSERLGLYGIRTGISTQAEWREILGLPNISKAIDMDTAMVDGIPEGQSDCYQFGDHELTFYADGEKLLALIRLE